MAATTIHDVPITVPQFRSFVDQDDFRAIEAVFANNYIAEGPFAKQFHQKLLEITGAPYGVFACNGTLAIYLALKGLGVQPGDEFIVQDITFIASANGVEMAGCKPVFADIKSFDDPSIDLTRIQLTPKTKGIVIAHLYGTACSNIQEVRQFCTDNKLWLVEDAAQALAISNGHQHCGLFGDIGTFSFYADKTITTAEGGFIVTRHQEVYDRLVYLRNQGRKQSGTFVHPEIGYNFRITDMQAALGLSQLKKLDTIRKKKAELASWYHEFLSDHVQFLKINSDFSYIPFRVVAFVDDAEKAMTFMRQRGIEPRSMFYPLHRQPCYEYLQSVDDDFPNSNECFRRGINLPTWIGLTREQVQYTSQALLDSLDD